MTTQLLLVSDDSRRATAIGQHVADRAPAVGVTIATSWEDAFRKLDGASFDAVCVDARSGHDTRRNALALRDLRPQIRFIVARAEDDVVPESEMYDSWGIDEVIQSSEDAASVGAAVLEVLRRPFARRVATDTCIGRSVQQMEMEQTLTWAWKGHGVIVLCSGEAGSGKTRGSHWLGSRVAHQGGLVLWANGQESARWRPYGLWADAFDQLIAQDAESRAYAVKILRRCPAVGSLFPRLRDAVAPNNSNERAPDATAMQRAAVALLRDAATRRLIWIGFDDVHLADRFSVELLLRLAPTISQLRSLIFVAYRNEELVPGPGAQAIHALEELSATIVVPLQPLSDQDIGEFVRRYWGRRPTQDEVDLARAVTGGNPRNLTTWLKREHGFTLADHGSLEHWLVQQVDRIPELEREVLLIASVIGTEFDATLLEEIWNGNRRKHEAQPIDGILRDLRKRHLVRETSGTARYVFAHPAVRDGLYARCSNRRSLHTRIAIALSQMHPIGIDTHAAVIADHFLRADSLRHLKKTLEFVDAAVAIACRHHEYDDAIKFLQRLLDGPLLSRPDGQRCDRLCALARILWQRGKGADAEERAIEALEIARRCRDASRFALAALAWAARGRGFGTAFPNPKLVESLERALEDIGPGDVVLEARLAAALADELHFVASERADQLANRARRAAQRTNHPAVQAEIASQLQWMRWRTPDLTDRSLLLDELAADPRNPRRRFDLAFARMWSAYERGEPRVGERLTDKCSRIASELEDPHYFWLAGLAELFRSLGRTHSLFDEQRLVERLETVRTYGVEAGNPQMAGLYFTAELAIAWFWKGRLVDNARHLHGLRKLFPNLGSFLHSILAMSYAYDGRLEDARHELSIVSIDELPKDETWLLHACVLGEAYAEVGDRARAARLYEMLLPFRGRMVIIPPVAVLLPVEYHLGRLACAIGQPHAAIMHLEAARRIEAPMGRPGPMACIELAMAEALIARGTVPERARADELIVAVIETCDRLDLQVLRRRATVLTGSRPRVATARQRVQGRLSLADRLCWFQLEPGPLIPISGLQGPKPLGMILQATRDGIRADVICGALDNRGLEPGSREDTEEPREESPAPLVGARYERRASALIDEAKRLVEEAEALESPDLEIHRANLRKLENREREVRRHPGKRPETRIRHLLDRTFDKIAERDPAAAQHLRMHVQTGKVCRYVPDLEHPVVWTITQER